MTRALCGALDEIIAPIVSCLDNFPSYLDLDIAPEQTLRWLSGWVGIELDPGLPPARQRELLRTASVLQGWQGTARGIALAVEALLGLPAEVAETGGAGWSRVANDPLPGEPVPALLVRVFPTAHDEIDLDRLDAVVEAVKPAHVIHRLEVVEPT
jgi:phage tail-like protein